MQNIGHAKMRRQLTKTSLSTKPPPPPYLSTEKLALWNKWSESSNTAVIREAANKGIYIDLAITYLSLRRKTPPGETRQYFDKEVLSWMHELIKNRQVFKATHILNNVGMDPAEEISKIFCDTTDIDLREYLGTHLQSKEKLDQDLINSWILLKNIRASDLYQTIKEQEIETFNLNNIHKRNKEWKSKIAIELYFKTFDFGLEPLIIKEMLWTQFLENEKIDFLLVWITENLHAKNRFELEFNAIEKQQLTKHFIEGLRKFLSNLQITKEMLELISTTTNKQKEQLLTELAKFGIFSTKESSNIPLILSRFRDANSLENFHKLFGTTTTTNNLSMQKKHFQESLMNHLLKEELHVVLNYLIVVNNKYLNKKTVNFDLNGQNVCKLIREIVNLNQNSLKIEEEKRNLCSFFEATVDYLNFNLNSKDKDYPPLLTLTMLVLTSNLKITKKEDNKNRIIIINENNAAKIPHLTTLNERLNVVIKEEDDEKVEGNLEDDEKAEGNEKLLINLENDEKAEGNKEFPINLEDVEKAEGNKKLQINSEDDEKVEGKQLPINSEDDEKAEGNKKLRINTENDEKAEGKKFPINSEDDEKAKESKKLRINSEIGEKAEGKKLRINSEDDEKAKGNKKLRINSENDEKAERKKLPINSEDDEKAKGNKKLRINSENDEKAEGKKLTINSENDEKAEGNKKLRINSEDDEKAKGSKKLQINSEIGEKAEGNKFPIISEDDEEAKRNKELRINSEDDEKAEGNKEYPDLTLTEKSRSNKKFAVNLTSTAIKTMRKELPFIDHIFKKLEGNEERKGFNYQQLFEQQLPIVHAKELFAFQHSKEQEIPHFSNKKLSNKYGENKKLNYTFFIKQGRPLMASIFYLSSRNSSSTKMQQNIQENKEINNEEKEKLSKQEEKKTNIQENKEINNEEKEKLSKQEEKETNIQEEKETNIQEEKEKLSKEEVKEKIGKEEVKEKMSKEEVKEKMSNEKEVKEKLSKDEVKEKMSNQEEVKEKMSNVEKVKGKLSKEEVKEKMSNEEEVKEKLIKEEVKEIMCKEEEVKDKMSKKEEVKEKLSKQEVKEKKSNEEEVKQEMSKKEEVKEKLSKQEVKEKKSNEEEVKDKLRKEEVKEKLSNVEEVKEKSSKGEVKEKTSTKEEVKDKLSKEEVKEKKSNEEEVKDKLIKEKVKEKRSTEEEVKEKLSKEEVREKLSNVEEVKDKLCKQEVKEETSNEEEVKEKLSKQEVKEKTSKDEEDKQKLIKEEDKEKLIKEEVREKTSNEKEVKEKLSKEEVKEKLSNVEEVKDKLCKQEVKEEKSNEEEVKEKLSKEEVKEKTSKREEVKEKFSKEEVKEKTDNKEEVKEKLSNEEEVKEKMCNQEEVEEKLSEAEKEELSNQIFKLVIKQFTNNNDNKNIKEIASSAVAFLELLNINSEELRVHIKIAELLDKKNNCELMLNNVYANPQLIYQLLENCMLERINSQQQDLQTDLQKDFSYMQLLVKFANIHNLPLPELYLKKHVLDKDLWILFLMYITCFNYPLKQVMGLVEYFSNGCIKEHFLNGVQMVENKSEKNVMRQRNARSSYLARVGVRRSGSESNLLAKNTQPVKKIDKKEKVEYVRQFTDLLEVLINAHNCIDPPKSLLKYAVMYKSPICALLTVSYEPESYLTAWLTWLMLTCNLNHHLKSIEMMNYSLQEVANILVECAEKLMLKKICLSFEIFIPEHPLRDFLQFIIDFKHLNQREDEEEATIILTKNLQSFKTKLESKKSANNSPFSRRNSEIEKTNQTKAAKLEQAAEEHQNQGLIYKNLTKTAWIEETASRLLFTTLQHEFTSKYSQIKFLKHLTNQGIKEFLPKTEIIEIVLKLLELLGDCDCLCPDLNLSLMLSPLEYRKEVIKCTEKLLNMNMYTKALEFLEISTVTLNFNLIKHWLINYKQIIENQIFETTKKDNFWLISDQHFNKKNQNQQANEVIEFYLQLIEKTENTNFEQTYQILNILNKWIIEEEESNSSNLQIETTRKIRRRKVERSLWSLYLQLLKKNKKKEKNIAPPIFQNVNENENTFQQDHEKEKEEDLKLLNKNKKKEKSIVPTFFQNANENENTFQQDHEKEEENLKLLNKTKKKEKSIAPPFFQNVNENENTFRHLDNHEREKEEDLKLLNKTKKKEKSIAPPFFQNVNENENTFRHLDNHEREKEEDLKLLNKNKKEKSIAPPFFQNVNENENTFRHLDNHEREKEEDLKLLNKNKKKEKSIAPPVFQNVNEYENAFRHLDNHEKEEDLKCFIEIDVKELQRLVEKLLEEGRINVVLKLQRLFNYQHCDTKILIQMLNIVEKGGKYIEGEEEEEQDYTQLKSKSKEEDIFEKRGKYIEKEKEQYYMQLKLKSKEEDIVKNGSKYIQGEKEQDYMQLKSKSKEEDIGKNGSKYIQGEEEQDYMQLKSKSKEEDFVKNGSKYIQEEEEQDYMQLKSKSKEEDIVEKGDKYIQGEEEQDYSHLKLKEEEKCVITHKNDNKKKTFLPNTNDVLNILEKLCNSLIVAKNYGLKIMRTYRITINCLNLTYKEIDLISGDSKSGFILLKRVLNSKNCVKNKLTVIADFAFIFNWDNKELAQFIAQEVYDFEEKGRIENEVLWNDFVNFNQIYQLFLLNEGTSILGHKLLNFCSSIEEDPNKIGIEIELLIKAHDCFTNDCNMEGITLVLQKAHLLIYRLQMCSEWKLIVRLLIGIGRYTEMSYVFELLRINQQFEYLLTKSSTNKDGLLKVALLDYLIKINQFVVDDKEVNEEREEFYNMVALHFSLYSEIATLWEKEGENNINSIIYSTNKTSNQTLNNKKPILLIPSDETKVFVNKAMMYFTHAAEYHIHGDRMSKAMDCANKAQLLALQTFLLTQEENQELPCYCVLQLNDEEIRFLITNSALNFHHVHVLLEAYKYEPDWSLILFERCILKEDPQFLTDYLTNMSLSEELLISLSNRYVSSKILNENSSKTMRNLLKHLHSVHMKYKIASKLSFIDIAEDLLEGNQLAYLKDTVWKKGYHGEPL